MSNGIKLDIPDEDKHNFTVYDSPTNNKYDE